MDKYLKANLITELGIDKLPPERQAELLLKIGDVLYQAVIGRVVEELSESDRDEFDKLLALRIGGLDEKKDDEDAVFNFLHSKLPNLDEIVNEEIAEFKKESLETMDAIFKKPDQPQ